MKEKITLAQMIEWLRNKKRDYEWSVSDFPDDNEYHKRSREFWTGELQMVKSIIRKLRTNQKKT